MHTTQVTVLFILLCVNIYECRVHQMDATVTHWDELKAAYGVGFTISDGEKLPATIYKILAEI